MVIKYNFFYVIFTKHNKKITDHDKKITTFYLNFVNWIIFKIITIQSIAFLIQPDPTIIFLEKDQKEIDLK